jgi:predicted enzyme related to lactoylglutathione lyase
MATVSVGSDSVAAMGTVAFKDLCIDTNHHDGTLGKFWAQALGLRFEADKDAGSLVGDDPTQRVWMNRVSEAKSVKHRVHLDVIAASTDELVALGATMLEPALEFDRAWSVMADPEGGEFCVFVRPPDQLSSYRMYELVVDAVDPHAITQWWAGVFGCAMDGKADKGWWWLLDVPGLPFNGWDFVPVPEPKSVKNRVHWDILVDSVDELVAAGATVLRPRDDEVGWTVMADPEGNEFCAFVRTSR